MAVSSLENIVSLCKRRGFIFQSSEIYGGFGAVYDYGPLGVELKNNLSLIHIPLFIMGKNCPNFLFNFQ